MYDENPLNMDMEQVEDWLAAKYPAPIMEEDEEYTDFMQRQAQYAQYHNSVQSRKAELELQQKQLLIPLPPVGEDIAAVIDWVQATGATPVETLTQIYRSKSERTADRINAAKAVMDLVHRRMPSVSEVITHDAGDDEEHLNMLRKIESLLISDKASSIRRVA